MLYRRLDFLNTVQYRMLAWGKLSVQCRSLNAFDAVELFENKLARCFWRGAPHFMYRPNFSAGLI